MSNVAHFPGRPSRVCYEPSDIEPIDTLSDPIVGDDLSAAAGIYSWVGVGLVAWSVIGGLYWVLG